MGICAFTDCESATIAKGFCTKHYQRLKRMPTKRAVGFHDIKERMAVNGNRTESGCLEWTGSRGRFGYGKTGSKSRHVHRIAWELVNGPIPDGMFVCHRCDNPPCFEITHLFLGTPKDNSQDRDRKGRNGGAIKRRRTTHCRNGHEYTSDNTIIIKNKTAKSLTKHCRICQKLRAVK